MKEWVEKNAIGIMSKTSRYGGTYAHKDITFKFGMTAKTWRNKNSNLDGNIRNDITINKLICLANLENLNSVFINDELRQSERLERLNKIAILQIKLLNNTDIKYLKWGNKI